MSNTNNLTEIVNKLFLSENIDRYAFELLLLNISNLKCKRNCRWCDKELKDCTFDFCNKDCQTNYFR